MTDILGCAIFAEQIEIYINEYRIIQTLYSSTKIYLLPVKKKGLKSKGLKYKCSYKCEYNQCNVCYFFYKNL